MKLFTVLFCPLWLLVPLNICFAACTWTNGNTIGTAASASYTDVADCLDDAECTDGDTVRIPEGGETWANELEITESILLEGIGSGPTITDNTGANARTIKINTSAAMTPRLTNLNFVLKSDGEGAVFVTGSSVNWRIDNCTFTAPFAVDTCRGIFVKATYSQGLIDHCVFSRSDGEVSGIYVQTTDADAAWARALTLGTINAVVVENCTFTCGSSDWTDGVPAIDCSLGGRYIFRRNTVTNQLICCHGSCSASTRSGFSYEIYNNIFLTSGGITPFRAIFLRGGTGVVYGNTIAAAYDRYIDLINYRTCHSDGTTCGEPYACRCDGDDPIDGNEDATGYPCYDQIGRTTGQALSPLYEWDNVLDDATPVDCQVFNITGCDTPEMNDHIKENRDFYDRDGLGSPVGYTELGDHPLCDENYTAQGMSFY